MIVKIQNPDVSQNIQTALSQDYTSGATLNVDSSGGLVNGNYVLVGEPGLEKSEITNLTAAPGSTTLTVTSLNYPHPKGTPVYYLRWDKYSLEYKTTSAGAWNTYAAMPYALNYDAVQSEYRDTSATTTYYWRYRYYSTENTAYSDYSDTIAASGWPRTSVGYMIREIRKIINDPDAKTVSDEEIIRFLNAAQDKIYALYDRWWFLFKEGTAIANNTSGTGKYALPSDFGRLHTLLYNYTVGSSDLMYPLKYLSIVEFDYQAQDRTADTDDQLTYYSIFPGDSTNPTGYFKVYPIPKVAEVMYFYPRYYKTFTDLDSYADETEVPTPAILEDYALSQIYAIRQEPSKADYYDKVFREQIELLKLQQRKVVGSPRYLWKYQGPDVENRLFGNPGTYNDSDRENKW